jgi:hypothetical protein
MTPIVVWPEHFDLSFLWFASPNATQSGPHMNFGFAPYSAGIDAAYIYAYVWPLPEQYTPPQLPAPAYWNTQPWTGVVLPYNEVAKATDSEAYIEDACASIYAALMGLLKR